MRQASFHSLRREEHTASFQAWGPQARNDRPAYPAPGPLPPSHVLCQRRRTRPSWQRGFTLLEALVGLAIIALIAAMSLPNLLEVRRRFDHVRLARQVAKDALGCRIAALTSCRNVGLVFAQEHGKWYYTMVADRDGDGVSRKDFKAGVDTQLGPKTWLEFISYDVRVGVPRSWRAPDPGGDGLLPEDGMRAGNSDIISFSHLGHATPCTVYFNDGRERMLAVRINGSSGVIRAMEWRRGWESWREVAL